MKNCSRIISVIAFLSVLLWGCAKNDGTVNNLSLKQTVNQSALELNNAMAAISSSKAYSILTINDLTQKSASATDSLYRVYIPLDKIKGIYDYHPVAKEDRWGRSLIQFFNMTADNSKMIVRMPLKKLKGQVLYNIL